MGRNWLSSGMGVHHALVLTFARPLIGPLGKGGQNGLLHFAALLFVHACNRA